MKAIRNIAIKIMIAAMLAGYIGAPVYKHVCSSCGVIVSTTKKTCCESGSCSHTQSAETDALTPLRFETDECCKNEFEYRVLKTDYIKPEIEKFRKSGDAVSSARQLLFQLVERPLEIINESKPPGQAIYIQKIISIFFRNNSTSDSEEPSALR